MIIPPLLKKGDKIAIWAPSSCPFKFPIRFQRSLRALKNEGFDYEVGASCTRPRNYSSEYAQELAAELHAFLLREDINGIFCATGGWTSIFILPYIDWELLAQYPKCLVGYSDVTAILLGAYTRSRLITFHGPMLLSEWGEYGGPWEYTVKHLKNMLMQGSELQVEAAEEWTDEMLWWDREDSRKRSSNPSKNWRFFREGYANGILVGGNLTTLNLLIGTPYFPSLENKILFIETEGYSPERLLAYLMQLKYCNKLHQISGLIVGKHARTQASTDSSVSMEEILDIVFCDINIPILIDVDLGHTEPMLTIPIGARAIIDSSENRFTILAWQGGSSA